MSDLQFFYKLLNKIKLQVRFWVKESVVGVVIKVRYKSKKLFGKLLRKADTFF
jgi:hypothetical protein